MGFPCATRRNIYVRTKRSAERVMASITSFLEERLKLTVNQEKSAVDRPCNRQFLGYGMTNHRTPKLKTGEKAVERLKSKLREISRKGRGRNLRRIIEEVTPILRGWSNYFKLSEVKKHFDELDSWFRRKLRCILWRQWKRPFTRAKKLMQRGLSEARAWRSALNKRGPWWNSGASHMNQAFAKSYFTKLGLISLLTSSNAFSIQREPPCTEPYARWCGRTAGVIPPPTRWRIGFRKSGSSSHSFCQT